MNRVGSLERKVADESTYLYAWFRDHLKVEGDHQVRRLKYRVERATTAKKRTCISATPLEIRTKVLCYD